VQQARSTHEMISFVQNDVLYYKVSPYSNIVGYNTIPQIRKTRFRYGTWY
jgi:hypothetical protein